MSPGTPVDEVLITTCPRDCYDSCGIRIVKRGGAVVAVRGDPGHPVSRGTLCGKCSTAYNREWRDPQRRLTRPLRRVRPKARGGGARRGGRSGERLEPVSWEAAIGEIAARLKRIAASHGPQSILNAHYTG